MNSRATPVPVSVRASTACPTCAFRHVIDITARLVVQEPGSYSLAGAQRKVVASLRWTYACVACGATGPVAAPGDLATLESLPAGECGHRLATGHYPGHDDHGRCAGCCPACQAVDDAGRP